ncbi:hypothetical protein COCON_G00192850 [Conger conger]|uniref:Sacsin/Nov domain-containing protein n=1 Tax=Conger conger TaxID=82655 RepID=A0A9Q1HRP7_CONCO|nr:hypothetical protein COCON_G00192850 [Conger conger]
MVWKHLYINFADDLSIFEDMPLIPNVPLADNMDSLELLRLRTPSPIILIDEEEAPLPESLPEIMKKLGVVVIEKLDSCLQHPLLKNYIHLLSPSTLLHVMDRYPSQRVVSQISSLDGKHKVVLRGFLAGLSEVTEKEKYILQELAIFEKIGPCTEKGMPMFIPLKGARALHHSAKLPADLRLSVNIIDCSDEATIRLIKMLRVEQIKSTECLKLIVQDLEKNFYAKDEVTKIMFWVLEHLSFLKNENPSVIKLLSSQKFILASSGKPIAATDLFDPELEILQNLFYMEEKTRFPPSTYTSSPDILHSLRQLGLKLEEVLPSHVFDVVNTVKKRTEEELPKEESKHNLLLLINILRWLYNSQISVDNNMHVPILNYKDTSKLAMKPIHECTYCDIKVDDLNDLLDDVSEPIILVHDDIPMKTAEWLKVPCLSTRLINPENLGFEQSGQREPLTVRIKNILEEYPSVSDIFKELLQNADDASATECSFLIDMRKNLEIRENLLDPGMVICHGPALWSFNNSVFSDTDFLNITRLGGSMKRCEADKVGKFGLGFNSVYHVTDIPIIMSREFMIMFDPNINHISKHIRDRSNPGIKINWSKQQKRLRKFPNQFKPFINVFNCQLPLSQESPYKYNGTLFRLPFRTEQEASMSEISSIYYNTTDIYSLVDEFSICGHRLILFTQHVGSMVLKYLKYEEPNPAASQDVITINKSVWSSKAAYGPLSILKAAAKVMKKVANTNRVPADVPKSGCIIRIVVEEFHNVFKRIVDLQSPLFRGSDDDPSSYFELAAKGGQTKRLTDEMPQKAVDLTNWLICSCMDVNEALKFSLSESGRRLGLVPCGAVAVLLSEGENRTWTVKTNPTPIGEVFCYLPLRIKTGLPVHINGCFAVTSNRKEIWKTDTKGNWNSVFMRHVIVQAYLAALSMLRNMAESGELLNYSYYATWPDPGVVHDDFTLISQGVYQEIAKGGDNDIAKVFSDGTTWVSIKHVRFLDDSLLCRPDIGPAAFKIFLKYLKKTGSQDLCAVELPDWVKEGFDDAGCKEKLMENTLTEKQFFSDVFFPHIQDIDKDLRDPLMHYVLNEKLEEFAAILKVTPCIPCSNQTHQLFVPSRLIHPEGRVAKLYNSEDGRFPEGTTRDYLNPVCLVKLVQLGMVKDDLSWEDLIERSESVVKLNESDHTAACLRSSILLSLIDEKLKISDPKTNELQEKLQNICFLPFLTKPAGFSLP